MCRYTMFKKRREVFQTQEIPLIGETTVHKCLYRAFVVIGAVSAEEIQQVDQCSEMVE